MKHTSLNILLLTPFLAFFASFVLLHFLAKSPTLTTPRILGNTVTYAAIELGKQRLNLRVTNEHTDEDLPNGTIIRQNPRPGQSIKAQQTVYCVATKKPPQKTVPQLVGVNEAGIKKTLEEQHIPYKIYFQESTIPSGTCIGQFPLPKQELGKSKMIIYMSTSTPKPVIFPDLKQRPIADVQEFFEGSDHTVSVHHTQIINAHHNCNNCIVVDQRPMAGSLLQLTEPLTVQVQVEPYEK